MSNRVYHKSHRRADAVVVFSLAVIVLSIIVVVMSLRALFTAEHPKEEPAPKVEVLETIESQTGGPVIEEPVTEEKPDRWGMTTEELEVVKRVVAAEARGESYLGQMAVAQCIRETAEVTGKTPYEVVMEPNQYASPYGSYTDSVSDAVWAVLYNDERAVAEDIRFFYAPRRVYSKWHEENLEFVCEIGGHRFFKTK